MWRGLRKLGKLTKQFTLHLCGWWGYYSERAVIFFFPLGNCILPSDKEKWCQAWVWCCLHSGVLCCVYPRPLAVCQELACWPVAGGQCVLIQSPVIGVPLGIEDPVFPQGQVPSPCERQQCWVRRHWLARSQTLELASQPRCSYLMGCHLISLPQFASSLIVNIEPVIAAPPSLQDYFKFQ